MENATERFSPARGCTIFAAILWATVLVASASMAMGNPTAINAVIGCSIPAIFVTGCAWGFHRQDCRHAEEMRTLNARLDGE